MRSFLLGLAFAFLGGEGELPRQAPITLQSIVRIPAGDVTMGTTVRDLDITLALCRAHTEDPFACSPEAFAQEMPVHRVHISAFGIDRTEVTQAAYRRCVVAGHCVPALMSENDPRVAGATLPVVGVSYDEAARYCDFVSGRLPTEAEWERAARGDDARTFTWGRLYNAHLANHTTGRGDDVSEPDGYLLLAPVGSFPEGASPFGVLDMAGNVFEWTSDYFSESYYGTSVGVDPPGPNGGGTRVIRGGSWHSSPIGLVASRRNSVAETVRDIELGFRCAYR